jgi:O-antigen/teichoic acid export membrane protein
MLALRVLVGVWFTKYLIQYLGVALYGIVPLAISVSSYINMLTPSLSSAVGRFFAIDLNQGELDRANQTFTTAFLLSVSVAAGLLPLLLAVSYLAPVVFDVPAGSETGVRLLFLGVMVGSLFQLIRIPFNAAPFTLHRFDLINAALATDLLVRVGLVVALFSAGLPAVRHVGFGVFAGGLASLGLAILIWYRLTPEVEIRPRHFDRGRLAELANMSGWVLVSRLGGLLFLSTDLIIVNLRLGPEAGGLYGSALQWHIMLRTLAMAVGSVLTPIIIAQYARGDKHQLALTARRAVKLLGLGIALPVSLVAGLAEPLMNVWLGPEFSKLALLVSVLVVHLCVNTAVIPLFAVQTAFNRVRTPGLVTLGLGLLNVGLAWWWAPLGSVGVGVALAGALVLTLKNTLFVPLYAARIQGLPWYTFLINLIPGALATLLATTGAVYLGRNLSIDSWTKLMLIGGVAASLYAPLIYLIALNQEDRTFLRRTLLKRRTAVGTAD